MQELRSDGVVTLIARAKDVRAEGGTMTSVYRIEAMVVDTDGQGIDAITQTMRDDLGAVVINAEQREVEWSDDHPLNKAGWRASFEELFDIDLALTPDAFMRMLRRYRGVEDPCLRCHGLGTVMYSSGATWRGGAGTTSCERDVCDSCWGTGDRYRTGCDLRRLRDEEAKRVAQAAIDLLANSAGAQLGTCGGAVLHIIRALDAIVDKRGAPAAPYLPEMARALGNTLRRAIGAPERKL
jgi:hypothetical protein